MSSHTYAVEYILHFFRVVLVQHALQAAVLPEKYSTLNTFFGRGLLQVALQTLDLLYFFEGHPLLLAPLLVLVGFVVTQFAGVVDLTAGGFHVACLDPKVQLRM